MSIKRKHYRAYNSWVSMKQRCLNPKHKSFSYYKDVRIHPRWMKFREFLADMGDPPEGHTLDRVRNDLGYGPHNCRWATPKQQARNRNSNVCKELDGITTTLAEHAERLGISQSLLNWRIKHGL